MRTFVYNVCNSAYYRPSSMTILIVIITSIIVIKPTGAKVIEVM